MINHTVVFLANHFDIYENKLMKSETRSIRWRLHSFVLTFNYPEKRHSHFCLYLSGLLWSQQPNASLFCFTAKNQRLIEVAPPLDPQKQHLPPQPFEVGLYALDIQVASLNSFKKYSVKKEYHAMMNRVNWLLFF